MIKQIIEIIIYYNKDNSNKILIFNKILMKDYFLI